MTSISFASIGSKHSDRQIGCYERFRRANLLKQLGKLPVPSGTELLIVEAVSTPSAFETSCAPVSFNRTILESEAVELFSTVSTPNVIACDPILKIQRLAARRVWRVPCLIAVWEKAMLKNGSRVRRIALLSILLAALTELAIERAWHVLWIVTFALVGLFGNVVGQARGNGVHSQKREDGISASRR